MKKFILLVGTFVVCVGACAQEAGRVLSSTPVVQQVGVPRQVCTTEQVEYQQPKSGAGAVLGALAGGALGNASGGRGAGQAAATIIGAIGGSMVGDRIEGSGPSQVQDVQRCGTQTFFENRTVGYNVVYEYAGKQYSVQMPNDPGANIALQVSAVGANTQVGISNAPPVFVAQQPVITQQVYTQQQVIVRTPPVYYVPSYNAVPFSIGVGIGYWGSGYGGQGHGHSRGHGGGHYRHWR
jgi:uncharacterized protein YcfJ